MLATLENQEGVSPCQDELHTYQASHEEAPVVEVAQALPQAKLWPCPGGSGSDCGWLQGGLPAAAGCLLLACRQGLKTRESQAMGCTSTTCATHVGWKHKPAPCLVAKPDAA